MDLSIASVTAFNHGASALGRTAGQRDPAKSAGQAAAGAVEETTASATESASERPAREAQQASGMTPEEQRQLAELQQRDREVKAHELAHKSVAGRYVTGGSFTFQTGPDGQRYAIGGEVTIDSSSGSSPQETLHKAELIQRAALAPADPSPQDYRVASQAAMMAAEARVEISAQHQEQLQQQAAESKNEAEDDQSGGISPLGRRAIASFAAIGGDSSLRSDPDPIDEII